MAKYYSEFDQWCILATKKIKYRPDRQTVYGELYQHIEDRYLDFLEEGMDKEQAIKRTLEVMGSAEEIAPPASGHSQTFLGIFGTGYIMLSQTLKYLLTDILFLFLKYFCGKFLM